MHLVSICNVSKLRLNNPRFATAFPTEIAHKAFSECAFSP